MKTLMVLALLGGVTAVGQIPGIPGTGTNAVGQGQFQEQMAQQSAVIAAIAAARQAAIRAAVMHTQMMRASWSQSASPQVRGQAAATEQSASEGRDMPIPGLNPIQVRPTFGNPLVVKKPNFSVKGGKIAAGTLVRLKSDTHYSTIYYTTDGWTPTTDSRRYTGPIKVTESMQLQTIAVGPNLLRSPVSHAEYTVAGTPPEKPSTVVVPEDGILRAGTPLRLMTALPTPSSELVASSESAAVGDRFPLQLDQDLKYGDKIVAPKGTTVDALLTVADGTGSGAPGDLVFEVQPLLVNGKTIPLLGGETMEGGTGFLSTDAAIIKPGMAVTAFVAADTSVK